MEVGIEDCLHIEFEYNKSKYVMLTFSQFYSFTSPFERHDLMAILGVA